MNIFIRYILIMFLVLWCVVTNVQGGWDHGPSAMERVNKTAPEPLTQGPDDRKPVVAGSFYPADAEALRNQLKMLYRQAEDVRTEPNLSAVIVPHAGYVFSGQVAATAFAKIDPDRHFSRIFLVGTSHHMLLNGASVYNQGHYVTPLGTVPVDTALANRLIRDHRLFSYVPGAHDKEHSLEVQLPFLQVRLRKPFTIVPVIIGTQSAGNCKKLADILNPYFTPENLFVISSDFSHYPGYDDAVINDNLTAVAVKANSPGDFISVVAGTEERDVPGLVTSCCGWSSVLTLLYLTSGDEATRVEHVKYMNSGDSPYGDHDRVVGYHAFAFSREENQTFQPDQDSEKPFQLNQEEKDILLSIARQSIAAKLADQPPPQIDPDTLPEILSTHCGAFVTLHLDGRLRGCIGQFMPHAPLHTVVGQMARAAAFRDHRFSPVTREEMDRILLEISVLTPLKKIRSIDEFTLGEQGIYIIRGNRSGTFLPQVAHSTGWTKEEFLGHCARDKAGIGWNGWKEADLYTYEAIVFEEQSNTGKQ